MIVTVVLAVIIGIWLFINIRKMVGNIRQGKSIDGCDGNCSHCKGCGKH